MESWNELEVKPPPNLTSKVTTSQVSLSDLRKLSDTVWNALTLLKNQQTLYSEAATLSRLVYRARNNLRGDKGCKAIQKVHQCLRHILALNLTPIYENFFRTIPWDCSEKEIYCPTRQMLEYVLLRTQGFAALSCRIIHTCMEAASLFRDRMRLGHHWPYSLLCLGALSRIWSLTKHLLDPCIKWYEVMLPYLKKFEPKGPLWLSKHYVFPPDISQWLSLPWTETSDSKTESLVDFDANFNKSTNETPAAFVGHIYDPKMISLRDDVGVSISRASISSPAKAPQEGLENKITASSSQKLDQKIQDDDVRVSFGHSSVSISSAEENKIFSKTKEKLKLKKKSTDVKNDSNRSPKMVSKKKVGRSQNILKTISSVKSHSDVDALLHNETKNRVLTCSLSDQQWLLLKNSISRLNLKLKSAHKEKKKQHALENIRKALEIALL